MKHLLIPLKKGFKYLLDSNDRESLWEQVTECSSIKNSLLVDFSCEFVIENNSNIDTEPLNIYIQSLTNRIVQHYTDTNLTLTKINEIEDKFFKIVNIKSEFINKETSEKLTGLAVIYSNDESKRDLCLKLSDILLKINFSDDLLKDYTNRLFSSLPEDLIKWLAVNVKNCSEDSQKYLNQIFEKYIVNPMSQGTPAKPEIAATPTTPAQAATPAVPPKSTLSSGISDQILTKYKIFIENLIIEQVNDFPVNQHLDAVYNNLSISIEKGWTKYLQQIFPILTRFFKQSLTQELGNMLQALFINASTEPSLNWLHSYMLNELSDLSNWPMKNDNITIYNPKQIFDKSYEFLNNNEEIEDINYIVKSMYLMQKEGVIENNNDNNVILYNCALKIWNIDCKLATEIFLSNQEILLDVEQIIQLGFNNIENNEIEINGNCLFDVWNHFASKIDSEKLARGTLSIAKQLHPNKDKSFNIWLNAIKGKNNDFATLQDAILEDIENTPNIMNEIPDYRTKFNEIFVTENDRNNLAEKLIIKFANLTSKEIKQQVAHWIKELDKNVIKLVNINTFSIDDIDILLEIFPEDKNLKKLKKELTKSDESSKNRVFKRGLDFITGKISTFKNEELTIAEPSNQAPKINEDEISGLNPEN